MPGPPKFYARGSKKKSSSSPLETFVYGLLCLALVGFFAWRFWAYEHSAATPVPHSIPASPPKSAPTPIPSVPIAAVPKPSLSPPLPAAPILSPIIPSTSPAHRDLNPDAPRPVENILEAQIALARLGISSGSIDGVAGSQTRAALAAFQRQNNLPPTGSLDSSAKTALLITPPAFADYALSADDFARLSPLSKTWLGKSEQASLDYESIIELLGEKSFASPQLLRALNPSLNWNALNIGTRVTLPRVEYPPAVKAALIRISLQACVLEAFDDNSNLLVHFPCSIGRVAEKRPTGDLRVQNIAMHPNYTFDPALFPEAAAAEDLDHKLIIPPGPRNPVGVAWIGLDRPGFGIHGTPAPEKVGRTESHGCFRLANWNAEYLAHMVWVGLPVHIE